MSLEAGMAALHMKFTDTVPRTEYSAHMHWPLVKKVTGIDTDIISNRKAASSKFVEKWDYAFFWKIYVQKQFLLRNGGRITKMGHAVYSEKEGGESDYCSDITNPFEDIDEALELDCMEEYGEFRHKELVNELEEAYALLKTEYPSTLVCGGIYITMFSGLIEIFGWDVLLSAMAMDEEKFGKVIESYFRWVRQFFIAYSESNIPVIISHDDLCWTNGPVTNPAWYRRYIFPYIKKLWEPIKEAGKKIIFTSDGDCTLFFDDIIGCGADMVVLEPHSDMRLFAEKYGKTHGFVGNADTRILLTGTKEDIYREVERCMNIGKKYPGYILSVGNHIPLNTPLDNALYYNEAYEIMCKR